MTLRGGLSIMKLIRKALALALALILVLFVFITYQDIVRLIGG